MNAEARHSEEVRYRALLELDASTPEACETLVAGLHDESWRVRRAAAEGLTQLPGRAHVVERLISVLGERDETGARNAAAESLAAMGESAVQPLVRLLRHADPDQRKFAADILGLLSLPQAEDPLVKAMTEDGDLNVRVAAAEALGRVGGKLAARALERTLHDPEPLLKLSVLESLSALRHPPPLPEVVPLLSNPMLKRSAYRVLGLVPQLAAVELVCRGLGAEVRSTREAALSALGTLASLLESPARSELEAAVRLALRRLPEAAGWVAGALEASDLELRAGALVAAGALREPQLAPLVAEVAQEERLVPEVLRTLSCFGPEAGRELLSSMDRLSFPAREAAGQVLVEMVDATHVAELIEMLDWGELDLKGVAMKALGRTRSLEAVEPLTRHLPHPELASMAARALVTLGVSFPQQITQALAAALDQGAQPVALGALVRVGGTAVLSQVRRLAREGSVPLRAAAVEVLAAVDPSGCMELARGALTDESSRVRAAAVRVLGQVGDAGLAGPLRQALQDEALEVRLAAIEAVGECGAVERVGDLEALVRHPDGGLSFRAVQSLARLGALRGTALRGAVAHADHEVVKAALLAGAASAEGVEVALGLLSHASWDVRAAAARVLGDSGGPECLGATRAALAAETDELARRALVDAVDRLSGR